MPEDLVLVRVGDERSGIGLHDISEVVRMVWIDPLPQMPEWMLGVINVRGATVPVIDLRLRLELPANQIDLKTPIVITSADPRIGMVVDGVESVVAAEQVDCEEPVHLLKGTEHPVRSIARLGDDLIMVLNVSLIAATMGDLQLPARTKNAPPS